MGRSRPTERDPRGALGTAAFLLLGLSLLVLVSRVALAPAERDRLAPHPTAAAAPAARAAADPAALVLDDGRPKLLEFYASWCSTCRGMEPTILALAAEHGARVSFASLDVDHRDTVALRERFDVMKPPVYVLLDGTGELRGRWQGAVARETLESALQALPAEGQGP